MSSEAKAGTASNLSMAGLLITLGIVFGDIGTSPLYTLQSIVGNDPISAVVVLGGVSAIFWTLTLQTTLKYVLLALNADNKGEGGIFALFALIRRLKIRWLIFPAMIGGAALMADGVITPAISVTSAVEGLKVLNPGLPILPIVILIIVLLFSIQRFGTQIVGKSFGPIMLIWFSMIGVLGFLQVMTNLSVLQAINPYYAYHLLVQYPQGFWLLGAIFLCTTGAEALYSDLGHCGKLNIRISWIFVKIALLLSYFGQAAWLLNHEKQLLNGLSPFFLIMPQWFLLTGIVIATLATIVASQALINGTFTIINEAIRLNLWPKIKVIYPTLLRGQMYIPSINLLLMLGCVGIILHFRESANMTIAYGFTIILAMLMTSVLLVHYMILNRYSWVFISAFIGVYATVELSFFISQVYKIYNGGWISLIISVSLVSVMIIWHYGKRITDRYTEFVKMDSYLPVLSDLSKDESVPKYASNLVFLTGAHYIGDVESKIMYSITQKQPKRADIYWFIHVDVLDEPFKLEYKVTPFVAKEVIRIDFRLGYKVVPLINVMFRKAVEEMISNKEIDVVSHYPSLRKHNIGGDFRFVLHEKYLSYESQIPFYEKFILEAYFFFKRIGLSPEKTFGLDTSVVTVEKSPLVISPVKNIQLERVT